MQQVSEERARFVVQQYLADTVGRAAYPEIGFNSEVAESIKVLSAKDNSLSQDDANAVRLALEDADYLERIAEEADDNNWQDWAASMRGAAAHIRAALVRSPVTPISDDVREMREALLDWRNSWLCPCTDFEVAVSRLLERTDAILEQGDGGSVDG